MVKCFFAPAQELQLMLARWKDSWMCSMVLCGFTILPSKHTSFFLFFGYCYIRINTFLSHTSCCRLWHLHQLKFLWRTCIWSWNSLGVAVWKMSLPCEGSCLKHRWDPWVLHHLADVWLLLLFVFSFVDITKSSAKNIVIHTCLDDCESLPRNGMTTTCLVFDIG